MEIETLEPPAPTDDFEHIAIDQHVVFNADALSDERLRTCAEGDDLLIRGVCRKRLDAPLCRRWIGCQVVTSCHCMHGTLWYQVVSSGNITEHDSIKL